MPLYFTRLHTGWPDDYKPPKDHPGSWRIYTMCTRPNPAACQTRADVHALQEFDRLAARSTYASFTLKAQTGLPLESLYDEKKCHEALTFNLHEHEPSPTRVWRIWGAGVIRVYFVYAPKKRIVLLKTWPKRSDKLTPGQKEELVALAKETLAAISFAVFEALEV